MRKPRLSEVVYEVVEFGEGNFPNTTKFQGLEEIFEKLKFGEVVIKVIGGEVESVQVTHHYKPMILEETLDTESKM